MKTHLILYCSLLVFFACKKKDNNVTPAPSTWTFAGTSYTASSVSYIISGTTANLQASAQGNTATTQQGLVFAFATPPTASGQLLITNTNAPNTVLAGEVVVSGSANTFYYNNPTNVYANVTVQNGKVSITFPGTIWLYNSANPLDSAQLSVGTITQN